MPLLVGFDKDANTSHLEVTSSGDQQATIDNTLSDTSQAGPALVALNNQLIWAWAGTNGHLYIAAQY